MIFYRLGSAYKSWVCLFANNRSLENPIWVFHTTDGIEMGNKIIFFDTYNLILLLMIGLLLTIPNKCTNILQIFNIIWKNLRARHFQLGLGCYRQQRVVVTDVKSDLAPVVSSVPQGTVLGPLLFSLHINDITADIESEIRLFADDCVCYRDIKDKEDTLKLQKDIDRLGNWARKWGMRFQPVKCNMMQLTRKHLNKIPASYTLEGALLKTVDNINTLV